MLLSFLIISIASKMAKSRKLFVYENLYAERACVFRGLRSDNPIIDEAKRARGTI